jgi:hypothetical protein
MRITAAAAHARTTGLGHFAITPSKIRHGANAPAYQRVRRCQGDAA